MMNKAIASFHEQFTYEPKIENQNAFTPSEKVILIGMGGSHLAGDVLLSRDPSLHLILHSDYGLPQGPDLSKRLIIASSYSGNTEEVVDAYEEAHEQSLNVIAIAVGGKLIDLAKENGSPYIQMPDTGIQPRSALGYSIKAIAHALGRKDLLDELSGVATELDPKAIEVGGKELAANLKDHVPVIYASSQNCSLAYNWKIKFNETGKIPAFYNVFPELNHNEMTGFDVQDSSKQLSNIFHFIILKDPEDHPRILKRMEALEKQYKERGLPVTVFELAGGTPFLKFFASLVLADWTAFHTAELYGLESEQVPMIEEFKKLIV